MASALYKLYDELNKTVLSPQSTDQSPQPDTVVIQLCSSSGRWEWPLIELRDVVPSTDGQLASIILSCVSQCVKVEFIYYP